MLVEINLLPQKEPKKIAFIIVLAGLLLVLLVASIYYYFQVSSTKASLETVNREIAMTQQIREKAEQQEAAVDASGSVSQLKSAIEWADTFPIETIPVMRHLTSLLPERGFIQSFGYTEAGTISLTVQFDSAREAAFFLNSLHGSAWIEDANLSSLTAAVQTDSKATDTEEATSDGETPVSPTATNEAVADNSYLPRYTGQFEIKLKPAVVKENSQTSKNDEEGVSGS